MGSLKNNGRGGYCHRSLETYPLKSSKKEGPFASYVTASLPRTPLACQMDSSSTREGASEGDTKVYDVPFISDGSIWKQNDVAGIHCQIGARGDVNCFAS